MNPNETAIVRARVMTRSGRGKANESEVFQLTSRPTCNSPPPWGVVPSVHIIENVKVKLQPWLRQTHMIPAWWYYINVFHDAHNVYFYLCEYPQIDYRYLQVVELRCYSLEYWLVFDLFRRSQYNNNNNNNNTKIAIISECRKYRCDSLVIDIVQKIVKSRKHVWNKSKLFFLTSSQEKNMLHRAES